MSVEIENRPADEDNTAKKLEEPIQLERRVGLLSGIALIVGTMIGTTK